MARFLKKNQIIIFAVSIFILLSGCHRWDNFTTYFNTYYNMNRIMEECEDEFAYQEEKKRETPSVYVPKPVIFIPSSDVSGPPPFMKDFMISQRQLQPVKTKLDSVFIKGSKIIAHHPNSDYIEGTLFHMAHAYFYRSEWLPSQIKCSELLDKYPKGEFAPDAQFLLAKNYLVQRKFEAGKRALSRCVDVSWLNERYDILSEAFRLEAELALYQNDEEGALLPYRQAIAQVDNAKLRAKWQVELAALLFRMRKFEMAEEQFAKVHRFRPDYKDFFEAKLYRASCLTRMEKYDESEEILEDLESDGKFEEWIPYVFAERMNMLRVKENYDELPKAENFADSAYVGNPAIASQYFEIGMDYFQDSDYKKARTYFARSKGVRSPVFETAQRMYDLMNKWEIARTNSLPGLQKFESGEEMGDTTRMDLAVQLFELGRIHERIGNKDSARIFYGHAVEVNPDKFKDEARYLHAYSRSLKKADPYKSDSLMVHLIENYPLTPYGEDAMEQKGYTDNFVIDTVVELYNSGIKLRKFGDYSFAAKQLNKVHEDYPESEYAPKALYFLGWMYEKDLYDIDSALHYYKILIDKYPNSDYTQDVKLSVDYLIALRSGKPIPDSLRQRQVQDYRAKEFKPLELDKEIEKRLEENKDMEESASPWDMLKNPKKILEQGVEKSKEMFQEKKDMFEEKKKELEEKKKELEEKKEMLTDPKKLIKDNLPGSDKDEKDEKGKEGKDIKDEKKQENKPDTTGTEK